MGVPGVNEPGSELCFEVWVAFVDALKEVEPYLGARHVVDLGIEVNKKHHKITSIPRKYYEEALQVATGLFELMSHLGKDLMVDYAGRDDLINRRLEQCGFKLLMAAVRSDCGRATFDESSCYFVLQFFGEDAERDFAKMDTTKPEYWLLQLIDEKKGCFMHLDDWVATIASIIAALARNRCEDEADGMKRAERNARLLLNRQLRKLKKQLNEETWRKLHLDEPYLLGYYRQKGYSPLIEEKQAGAKYQSYLNKKAMSRRIVFFLMCDIVFFNNPISRFIMGKMGLDSRSVRWVVGGMVSRLSKFRGIIAMTSMGNLAVTHGTLLEHVRGHLFLRELIWNTGGGLISAGLAFGDLPKKSIPMEELFPPQDTEISE